MLAGWRADSGRLYIVTIVTLMCCLDRRCVTCECCLCYRLYLAVILRDHTSGKNDENKSILVFGT